MQQCIMSKVNILCTAVHPNCRRPSQDELAECDHWFHWSYCASQFCLIGSVTPVLKGLSGEASAKTLGLEYEEQAKVGAQEVPLSTEAANFVPMICSEEKQSSHPLKPEFIVSWLLDLANISEPRLHVHPPLLVSMYTLLSLSPCTPSSPICS
jgi:hypothetical protein